MAVRPVPFRIVGWRKNRIEGTAICQKYAGAGWRIKQSRREEVEWKKEAIGMRSRIAYSYGVLRSGSSGTPLPGEG